MDASKEDIKTILDLIKRFLPQFPVTEDNLLNIKPAFVLSFYHCFTNELVQNHKSLFNCNFDFEDVLDLCPRDVNPELFLFLFTRNILNKIGVPYFSICDFYRPSNRTRTTMKVCLNFLFYTQENLSNAKDIVQSIYKNAQESQLRNERILIKKDELSDMSCKIGLLKEELEKLTKAYEDETKIRNNPAECDIQYNNEIKQLQTELEILSNTVCAQEHEMHSLNTEIKELMGQLVYEDYKTLVETSKELQFKIREEDSCIGDITKLLEEKHNQLEYINTHIACIDKIDLSPLDYVGEMNNWKQKIMEIESAEHKTEINVSEKHKTIETLQQDIQKIIKTFEVDINQLQESLLEANNKVEMYTKMLQSERSLQKQLTKRREKLVEELKVCRNQCEKLEQENNYIQEEHKRMYQKLLASQNLVVNTFNDVLKKLTKKYCAG